MKVQFTEEGWLSYTSWASDRQQLRRINRVIADIQRDADGGIGKPEILRGDLRGWLSRRIDQEHRLVYRVKNNTVEILSCRFHYPK